VGDKHSTLAIKDTPKSAEHGVVCQNRLVYNHADPYQKQLNRNGVSIGWIIFIIFYKNPMKPYIGAAGFCTGNASKGYG
jgi:hypothetical protein